MTIEEKKIIPFIVFVIALFSIVIWIAFFPSNSDFDIGDEVILYGKGLKTLPLTVDEESFEQLIKSRRANDRQALSELVSTGKIFSVYNNTRALILDRGLGKVQVRIFGGSHGGQKGWIIEEWVQPIPK